MTSLPELVIEKPVVRVEKTHRKERGKVLDFSLSLRSGKCERKAAGRSSEVSFDLSGFYPNF